MAHDFGHEAYELYGFSRAMTFDSPDIAPINDTDDLCAGGYMHGILEEVFLHDDDLQYHPEKICISVPKANQ